MVVVVFCKGDGMREYDSGVQVGQDGLVGRHRCGENCRRVDLFQEVCVIGMNVWWSSPSNR